MSEIIVGVDGTERGEDAVAFGRQLAEFAGARIVLANVFPYEDIRGRVTSLAYRDTLREASEELLTAARERFGLEASTRALENTSPARALHELAAEEQAALVVVGSSHVGRMRRVLPGSTGERLLHGSSCAVAVVPRDYRRTEHTPPRRIGVGVDGHDESTAALRGAAELARTLGAKIDLIRAFAPEMAAVDAESLAVLEMNARAQLDDSLESLAPALTGAATFEQKDPADLLIQRSHDVDLLVIGSRGYGPLHAVLLGAVSGRVIREAACPVIVVPRGAKAPLESLPATDTARA